jgi:NAD(P)-dependent dehydrogenase (short-subunit alcohol dehydrogenase family)
MIDLLEVQDLSRSEDLLKARMLSRAHTIDFALSGQVVLILGENSSLEWGMMQALLEKGFLVAVLDPACENLIPLRAQFPNLLALKCDPADPVELKTALDLIVRKWERIDILVNILPREEGLPGETLTLDRARAHFEKNFFLPLKIILEVLPQMEKQKRGIVHNVISPISLVGFKHSLIESAASGALESITRSLALGKNQEGIGMNIMFRSILPSKRSKGQMGKKAGASLAREILSIRPVITPDFPTSLFVFFARRYPYFMGKISPWLIKMGWIEP